jgi:hypothetical protein
MELDQVAKELNDPVAQELLDSPLGHLAYNGQDGVPRLIPVGFFWNGESIVVCTATTAPKVSALEARPEAAFTLDIAAPAAKMLSIRGRARVEIVPGIPPEYIEASRKGRLPGFLAKLVADAAH